MNIISHGNVNNILDTTLSSDDPFTDPGGELEKYFNSVFETELLFSCSKFNRYFPSKLRIETRETTFRNISVRFVLPRQPQSEMMIGNFKI